jgi:hypothetical protein
MLEELLHATPVRTIDEAVAVMTAIDSALPDADGLKWFNRLYLRVTTSVRAAVAGPAFRDPAFMTALDVVFANLYFAALTGADRGGGAAPSAWQPVLDARADRRIARLQFALAGMNAHINRDLPVGIVSVFTDLGGDPTAAAARKADFDAINDLLERVEGDVKSEFSVGLIAAVDIAAGRLDDIAAMWKVRVAREAAWTNAEVLWTLRPMPRLGRGFLDRLDGLTGLAGKGLLLPTGLDAQA